MGSSKSLTNTETASRSLGRAGEDLHLAAAFGSNGGLRLARESCGHVPDLPAVAGLSRAGQYRKSGTPTISVITPVFNLIAANRRETVLQTIESVACQSSRNVEHVIADGNSSDGTQEFISQAISGKSRVRFISKRDRNLYGGKNNGAEASTGDYLMFINSDDYLIDSHIVETLTCAVEKERPSLVFGSIQRLDEAGVFQRSCPPGTNIFLRQMPFSTQAMAVRRDVFFSLSASTRRFRSWRTTISSGVCCSGIRMSCR